MGHQNALLGVETSKSRDFPNKIVQSEKKNGLDNFIRGFCRGLCISPSAPLAIDLMQKDYQDKSWCIEWLKGCTTKVYLSSDFCYAYSVFLKAIDPQESKVWLLRAKDMGHKKAAEEVAAAAAAAAATEELDDEEAIDINVRGYIIRMIRVDSPKGDFYIAKEIISRDLFLALNCGGKGSREDKKAPCRKRRVCDNCLALLSSQTIYYWQYPEYEQWNLAKRLKKINPSSNFNGEWCKERTSSGEGKMLYRVAGCSEGGWAHEDHMSYLRPVLAVSKNSKLL